MNKNKFLDLLNKHKFNVILFILILAAIIFNIVLYYTTHFEKTIIKDKYTRYRRHGSNNYVVDTDNNIYQVGNVWFNGLTLIELNFNKLEKGKKYKVEGYGIRVPVADMYKNIYQID